MFEAEARSYRHECYVCEEFRDAVLRLACDPRHLICPRCAEGLQSQCCPKCSEPLNREDASLVYFGPVDCSLCSETKPAEQTVFCVECQDIVCLACHAFEHAHPKDSILKLQDCAASLADNVASSLTEAKRIDSVRQEQELKKMMDLALGGLLSAKTPTITPGDLKAQLGFGDHAADASPARLLKGLTLTPEASKNLASQLGKLRGRPSPEDAASEQSPYLQQILDLGPEGIAAAIQGAAFDGPDDSTPSATPRTTSSGEEQGSSGGSFLSTEPSRPLSPASVGLPPGLPLLTPLPLELSLERELPALEARHSATLQHEALDTTSVKEHQEVGLEQAAESFTSEQETRTPVKERQEAGLQQNHPSEQGMPRMTLETARRLQADGFLTAAEAAAVARRGESSWANVAVSHLTKDSYLPRSDLSTPQRSKSIPRSVSASLTSRTETLALLNRADAIPSGPDALYAITGVHGPNSWRYIEVCRPTTVTTQQSYMKLRHELPAATSMELRDGRRAVIVASVAGVEILNPSDAGVQERFRFLDPTNRFLSFLRQSEAVFASPASNSPDSALFFTAMRLPDKESMVIGAFSMTSDDRNYLRLDVGFERDALPTMLLPRKDFALAVCQGANEHWIYAIGGRNEKDQEIASVERCRLNFVTLTLEGEWEEARPLPAPRYDAAVAVYRGKIWLTGGRFNQNKTDMTSTDTMFLDPKGDGGWKKGPPLNLPRHSHGMTVLNGKLIAVGGGNGSSKEAAKTIEVLEKGRWCLVTARLAREARFKPALASHPAAQLAPLPGLGTG